MSSGLQIVIVLLSRRKGEGVPKDMRLSQGVCPHRNSG